LGFQPCLRSLKRPGFQRCKPTSKREKKAKERAKERAKEHAQVQAKYRAKQHSKRFQRRLQQLLRKPSGGLEGLDKSWSGKAFFFNELGRFCRLQRRRLFSIIPGAEMKRSKASYRTSSALTARLKVLRRQAGLSQRELARRMGRQGSNCHNLVSRLERGKVRYPSLALVADYLRGCRARFDDILDLLNEYAAQPPVPEVEAKKAIGVAIQRLPEPAKVQVQHYDAKTTARARFEGRPPLSPEQRIDRACRLAAALFQRAKLENRLAGLLDELKVPASATARRPLAEFGRKVWGILKKTRAGQEDKRPVRLEQAVATALERHDGTEEHLRRVLESVRDLFFQMEKQGELDYVPPYGEVSGIRRTRVIRAERRAEQEEERRAKERSMRPLRMLEAIGYELEPVFGQLGIEPERRRIYRVWLRQLLDIGLATTQDSGARQQQVQALVAQTSNPAEAAQVAAAFWPPFDKWLKLLKPDLPQAPAS